MRGLTTRELALAGDIRINGAKQFSSILRLTAALGHDWDLRLAGVLSSVAHPGKPLDSDPLSDWGAQFPPELADLIQVWHSHSRLLVASWLSVGASTVRVEELYAVVEAVEEVRRYVSDWRMKQSGSGISSSPFIADEGTAVEGADFARVNPYNSYLGQLTDEEVEWMELFPPVLYVSGGRQAETFHKAPDCTWLLSGRRKASLAGADLPPIERVSRADAIYPTHGGQPRRPCQECFQWIKVSKRQAQVPAARRTYVPDSAEAGSETLLRVGDTVVIVDGPFASLSGRIAEASSLPELYIVSIAIFDREALVEMSPSQLVRQE